jgi:hypothetical protein
MHQNEIGGVHVGTKIIETPDSKMVCDSCDYDMIKPTYAKYQIRFSGGVRLCVCFSCFDTLYDALMKHKESK